MSWVRFAGYAVLSLSAAVQNDGAHFVGYILLLVEAVPGVFDTVRPKRQRKP